MPIPEPEGTEWVDPFFGSMIVNETDVSNDDIMREMLAQNPEVAALGRWSSGLKRTSSLFERDRYVTPVHIFDQMRVAQDAAENDDVVASVLESTEALAFGKMRIETEDQDEEDIWNQISDSVDLDSRMREMWRELFTVSQFYAVTLWGTKSFKVSGRSKNGVKRKKAFPGMRVPIGISLLDPLRVIPVGNLLFNQEQLVYISSDRSEQEAILNVLSGGNRSSDLILNTLMTGEYKPTDDERKRLGDMGISSARLFKLNPANVWRHTSTRPQYKRFADVRLKSVFELLDLKHQLREMDRSHLIGGTNFIILVKKGSDEHPALPGEVTNLQSQVRTLARVPVIVGDHRLNVEIVTPANDHTLEPKRYDVLDAKIAGRLYQTFSSQTTTSSRDDSLKVGRVIARGMESRRYMLTKAILEHILKPTFDSNADFTDMPDLIFSPKQIALDFDPALANYIFDLRDRGDLSRETTLAQIDLDEDDEARKREREAEYYDDIFQTAVPFNSPANQPIGSQTKGNTADTKANPRSAGRTQGGNRNGGGSAPGTGQGKPAANPRKTSK